MRVHLLSIIKLNSKMYFMVFYFAVFVIIANSAKFKLHSMATFTVDHQSNSMISEEVPDTAFDGYLIL